MAGFEPAAHISRRLDLAEVNTSPSTVGRTGQTRRKRQRRIDGNGIWGRCVDDVQQLNLGLDRPLPNFDPPTASKLGQLEPFIKAYPVVRRDAPPRSNTSAFTNATCRVASQALVFEPEGNMSSLPSSDAAPSSRS
jgi:hypothetical protein